MANKETDEALNLVDYYARQRLISPQARDKLYKNKSLTAKDVEEERGRWENPSGRWYEKRQPLPQEAPLAEAAPRPAHYYGPSPKISGQGMALLQDALLKVREGKMAGPTQQDKAEVSRLLLGTPEENEARAADYAETERIKRLVAAEQAGGVAGRHGGSTFTNPITGRPTSWRVIPEGFEEAYSEKQKQQIARDSNAIQEVSDNPGLSERDKEVAIRKLTLRINNNKPTMRIKEPPPPMGDSWDGTFTHPETGDIMGYDRNKKPRVLTHRKDTPKGIEEARLAEEEKWQREIEHKEKVALLEAHARRMEKEIDIQAKRQELIASKRLELLNEDVEDGVDAKGEVKYRKMRSDEADKIIRDSGLLGVSNQSEYSVTRVAAPEQLRWGPSGMPPAGGPQPPSYSGVAQYSKAAPPVVRSDADYNKLPSGAVFVDENGKRWSKP